MARWGKILHWSLFYRCSQITEVHCQSKISSTNCNSYCKSYKNLINCYFWSKLVVHFLTISKIKSADCSRWNSPCSRLAKSVLTITQYYSRRSWPYGEQALGKNVTNYWTGLHWGRATQFGNERILRHCQSTEELTAPGSNFQSCYELILILV